MIRWPIELIDDIAKRNSVLYLGSGISAASKNDSGKIDEWPLTLISSPLTIMAALPLTCQMPGNP